MSQDPFPPNSELCHMVIEHLLDHAIFKVDSQEYFRLWSIGVLRLFGYNEFEFIGQPATLISPSETKEPYSLFLRRTLDDDAMLDFSKEQDESLEVEQWYIRKDGTRFWATSRTIPVCDAKGEIEAVFQIVRDDSVRHELEERLRQQNTQ
jgi:PAS domain S-box-containing protein